MMNKLNILSIIQKIVRSDFNKYSSRASSLGLLFTITFPVDLIFLIFNSVVLLHEYVILLLLGFILFYPFAQLYLISSSLNSNSQKSKIKAVTNSLFISLLKVPFYVLIILTIIYSRL